MENALMKERVRERKRKEGTRQRKRAQRGRDIPAFIDCI